MSLEKYIQKRDFKNTSEPKSGKANRKALRFVVQRHHASHLHYDFRLEIEGVLKSWAVPKGPSLNPKDKRLAMMVEDHPFDYRTFEGMIPAGNYGAGVVTIFDEGTYESLEAKDHEKALKKGLYSGNLKFRLKGKILKGEFALVKLKSEEQNAWLLIKHKDEYAVSIKFNSEDLITPDIRKAGIDFKKKPVEQKPEEALVKTPSKPVGQIPYTPMMAKLSSEVFDDPEWVYEKKMDGYRCLAYKGDQVKLISRNGIDFKNQYKPVQLALRNIAKKAVIDGELVIEDKKGKSQFQELQNYDSENKSHFLKYYVFDLLYLDGHDLRGLKLLQRKELLKALIREHKSKEIIYNEHVVGKVKGLLNKAEKEGWEGIIAKSANSLYESGKRSGQWLKFKLHQTQEALICGFTLPAGSRKYFGALVLGIPEGKKIKYIGNCGTGFTEASHKDLFSKMKALVNNKKPFIEGVNQNKSTTWIKPELVCDINYTEWTTDGHLRHPVFKGLRMDKAPQEVKPEMIKPLKSDGSSDVLPKVSTRDQNKDETKKTFGKKIVKLTNLNKLFWKDEGISKGQLLNYYEEISGFILPYLKDHPLSLNRHPNGIDDPGFYQKDIDLDKVPSWIKSAPIHSESTNKNIDYLICNDLATLLWMVNLGCIEINPWLSTYKHPENPDFLVIDLDPQSIDFKLVVEAALVTKEVMESMGLISFIKTSGSRGLHMFVNLGAKYDYGLVKMFAEYLAKLIHKKLPDTTSIVRTPSKRKNLIYLDFLQNRRGQTIASVYSARPKPGATVSTPLYWKEVNNELNTADYTIFNTIERIKQSGDPWKDLFLVKADLKKALKLIKPD